MKTNITTYKRFLALILAIYLAFSGNWLNFAAASSPSQPKSNQTMQPPRVIKVVQAMRVFELAPTLAAFASMGMECLAAVGTAGNGIQSQAGLNLNQPANCFTLVDHQASVLSLPKISVSGLLYQNIKISVLTLPGTVIKFLNSAHMPKDIPAVLPIAAALAVVYVVISSQVKRSSLKFYMASVSVFEPADAFVILRC